LIFGFGVAILQTTTTTMKPSFLSINELLPNEWFAKPSKTLINSYFFNDIAVNYMYCIDPLIFHLLNTDLLIGCANRTDHETYKQYTKDMLLFYKNDSPELSKELVREDDTNCSVIMRKIIDFYCLKLLKSRLVKLHKQHNDQSMLAWLWTYVQSFISTSPSCLILMREMQKWCDKNQRTPINLIGEPISTIDYIGQICYGLYALIAQYHSQMLTSAQESIIHTTLQVKKEFIYWPGYFHRFRNNHAMWFGSDEQFHVAMHQDMARAKTQVEAMTIYSVQLEFIIRLQQQCVCNYCSNGDNQWMTKSYNDSNMWLFYSKNILNERLEEIQKLPQTIE
jgi:hypothetical protein